MIYGITSGQQAVILAGGGGGITVKNQQYSAHSASTATTVSMPSGLVDGDLVVVFFMAGNALSITSSGWNSAILNNSQNGISGAVFYKIMGAVPDTDIQFAHGSEFNPSAVVYVIENYDPSNTVVDFNSFSASSGGHSPEVIPLPYSAGENLMLAASGYRFLDITGIDTPPAGFSLGFIENSADNNSESTFMTASSYKVLTSGNEQGGAYTTPIDTGNSAIELAIALKSVLDYTQPPSPVEVVGIVTGREAAGAVTLTLPGTIAENDIVFAFAVTRFGTGSVPSGYTSIRALSGSDPAVSAGYKIMTSTPDASVTIGTSAAAPTAAMAIVLRNVSIIDIFDSPVPQSTGSGDPNCPAITTVKSDVFVLAMGFIDDDSITSSTPPSGYSNGTFIGSSAGLATTNNASIVCATKQLDGVAVLEDPAAFVTDGDDSWVAWMIPLRTNPGS